VTPPPSSDGASARARPHPLGRPAPEQPARRHLRVVDQRTERQQRQMRMGIWAFGVLSAISVFVIVAFHVGVAQSQLQLDRLNREVTVQQQRYERLRLDVAQLAAPPRIAERARQLGMQPGGPSTFLTVPKTGAAPPPENPTSSTEDYQKVKKHLGARP
jgi:cell division protein FtsL